MESPEFSFLPLLIVLGIAFLVPILLSRLSRVYIPIVVGEILAGILVGRSGLGLVDDGVVLDILSTIGFIYLMFLSGLEIHFSGLLRARAASQAPRWRRIVRSHLFLAVACFLATLLLSLAAAVVLAGLDVVRSPVMMALILSTTSLGVVMPVLKQEGYTNDPFGQFLMACSLVADFASIFLISVYVLLHHQGLSAEILLVLVLLAAFAIIYRAAAHLRERTRADRFFEKIASATSQIRMRGALALALFFVVLARTVGTESILGAFLAGVIVSMLARDEGSSLREKLDAIGYGFFIPIFFIMVGVDFDLPALFEKPSTALLVPVLVAAAFIVKIVPAVLFRVAGSWRGCLAAGSLLSARLSLIIAASAIGLELGTIDAAVNSAVILVAVVTCTLSPPLFKALAPAPEKARDRILLVGCRHWVDILVRRLRKHDLVPKAVCPGDDIRRRDAGTGVPTLKRREKLKEALVRAGIASAKTVVVLEERDEDALLVCRLAKELFQVEHIVAWVQDPARMKEFQGLGARPVNPALSTTLLIESLVLHSEAYPSAGDEDAISVRQVKLRSDSLTGCRVDELPLAAGVTVLSIEREGAVLLPDNETRLRKNDTLSLAGSARGLMASLQHFNPAAPQ